MLRKRIFQLGKVAFNRLSHRIVFRDDSGLIVESFDVLVGGDPSFKGKNQQQGNGSSSQFAAKNLLNQETSEPIHFENAPRVFLGEGKISVFA